MSVAGQRALAEQQSYEEAVEFLCRHNVLQECDNHPGTYFEGECDIENAYKAANAGITDGSIKLGRAETRRNFTDRLKAAHDGNVGSDGCPDCDRAFGHED